MARKPTQFVNDEYYHVYNRGTDKRNIILDERDLARLVQSMKLFNTVEPIGSIYEVAFERTTKKGKEKLVETICYCINPNHYHLILKQLVDNGISEFMKRLGGYVSYFNNRHKRSGTLFQGRFKTKYIDSNEYLLHLSAYVNLNNRVHQLKGPSVGLTESSWEEYTTNVKDGALCNTSIILGQFENKNSYKEFALDSLETMVEKKRDDKEMRDLLIE